jgi:Tfp pilus assembly protein PilF
MSHDFRRLALITMAVLTVVSLHADTEAERHYASARNAFLGGDYSTAAREVDEAIRLNRNWGDAHRLRGSVFSKVDQLDKALDEYQEAIRLNPMDADSYYNLGWVFDHSGKPEASESAYSKSIELRPDAETYNNRGWVRLETRKYDDARGDFRKAITMNPEYTRANLNLGALEVQCGHYADAIAPLTRTLELDPKNVSAFDQRAIAYEKVGQAKKAERDRNAAAALRASGVHPALNIKL